MADPLSVVAGITGVLAFTGQCTRQIIAIIAKIQNAPDEITDLRFELQHLSSLVQSAHNVLLRNKPRPEDRPLEDTVKECLQRCQDIMKDIEKQLSHFFNKNTGRRSPLRAVNWFFQSGQITALKDRLRDSRAMLELSITVLNSCVLHLTHLSVAEIGDMV
jgi:hypothetical protein